MFGLKEAVVSFEPHNDLERSLVKAGKDPAHRLQFYRDLVQSDIFIIGNGQFPSKGERRVDHPGGTSVQIQHIEYNGKPQIPIFSSIARPQAILTHQTTYLGINALAFLKMTKGTALVLNPESDYVREITADEAARIVDGSIWKAKEQFAVQALPKAMIDQPKIYSTELVTAMTRLFKTNEQVKRTWLAHLLNPDKDLAPDTLIAMEVSGEFDTVSEEEGTMMRAPNVDDPPADFLPVKGLGGIEKYFVKGERSFSERRSRDLF